MRIAIPSHNRAGLIGVLTLAYLKRCSIQQEQIDIFVSNTEQVVEYSAAGVKANALISCNTTNVRDKFNFIHSYYPAGTEVLVIEDDIESIQRLAGYNKLEEITNLTTHAAIAFDLCVKYNTKLWGISSNNNPFFLKEQAGLCFKMVVANMYGFISEEPPLLITQHTKTDYERTILYTLKYGGVIRLDYLCPITRNYKNPGGMQELSDAARAAQEQEASQYLANNYPELCSLNTKKSSKFAEVTLTTKRIKPTNNTLFDGI